MQIDFYTEPCLYKKYDYISTGCCFQHFPTVNQYTEIRSRMYLLRVLKVKDLSKYVLVSWTYIIPLFECIFHCQFHQKILKAFQLTGPFPLAMGKSKKARESKRQTIKAMKAVPNRLTSKAIGPVAENRQRVMNGLSALSAPKVGFSFVRKWFLLR